MKDLYSDERSTTVLKPIKVTSNATGNGAGTDLLGFRGCLMIAALGASADVLDGSNYYSIKFLESSNNTVFSAIADTDLIGGTNTAVVNNNASANSTHQRSYTGAARYVTVSISVAGTIASGTPISAHVVKGKPLHGPIA